MFLITFQHYGQVSNLATAENLTIAKWFVSKETEQKIKEDEWQQDQDNESKWVFSRTDSQFYIIEGLKHVS